MNDGVNQYLYDGEGRICAVANGSALIGYIYNAEGQRVSMGTITAWSCDPGVNGFRTTNDYFLVPSLIFLHIAIYHRLATMRSPVQAPARQTTASFVAS